MSTGPSVATVITQSTSSKNIVFQTAKGPYHGKEPIDSDRHHVFQCDDFINQALRQSQIDEQSTYNLRHKLAMAATWADSLDKEFASRIIVTDSGNSTLSVRLFTPLTTMRDTSLESYPLDGNTPIDDQGTCILHRACQAAHKGALTFLMETLPKGAENQPLANGQTPLICAVLAESLEAVDALCSRENLAVNTQDNDGSTALQTAIRLGNTPIVRTILQHSKVHLEPDLNKQNLFHFWANYDPTTNSGTESAQTLFQVLLEKLGTQALKLEDVNEELPAHLAMKAASQTCRDPTSVATRYLKVVEVINAWPQACQKESRSGETIASLASGSDMPEDLFNFVLTHTKKRPSTIFSNLSLTDRALQGGQAQKLKALALWQPLVEKPWSDNVPENVKYALMTPSKVFCHQIPLASDRKSAPLEQDNDVATFEVLDKSVTPLEDTPINRIHFASAPTYHPIYKIVKGTANPANIDRQSTASQAFELLMQDPQFDPKIILVDDKTLYDFMATENVSQEAVRALFSSQVFIKQLQRLKVGPTPTRESLSALEHLTNQAFTSLNKSPGTGLAFLCEVSCRYLVSTKLLEAGITRCTSLKARNSILDAYATSYDDRNAAALERRALRESVEESLRQVSRVSYCPVQ